MATAQVNFLLQMEPTSSVHRAFPVKGFASASRVVPNHGRKTKHSRSKADTTSVSRKPARKFIESTEDRNTSTSRKLLSYLKMGCLEYALQMFDTMSKTSTFIWNVIIRGLVDYGFFEEAIWIYNRMQLDEGIVEDKYTFPFVIKACTFVAGLKEGKSVHSRIIKLGFDVDIYICNALIVMYAKVGCIEDSEKIFDRMPGRDVVSWNSMIGGYVSAGDGWSSLMCFRKMQEFGPRPDRFSLISALGACALKDSLLSGKEIFCHILRNGLELDSMIQSSVIDMFGKCGAVDYAERFCNGILFKNVVVWNAMIGAYSLNGDSLMSFACFEKMQEYENVSPDIITLINLLPSCSKLGGLGPGRAIHGQAIKRGFPPHLVLETALIDMYGRSGSLIQAETVFKLMKQKNLISWNAMIAAYVQNSHNRKAVETFQDMQNGPFAPDEITFVSISKVYAEVALPNQAKQLHGRISKLGISSNTFISNAIIHMYAKCGDLLSARKVFDTMPFKDVVSWNTIIMAYAIHGFGACSINLFSEMREQGIKPNASTFVSLLSSCSISGNAEEGWKYFNSMKTDYGLDPGIEHYGCMLDLLGRSGNFDRAERFIEEMPLTPTSRIWGSLLAASRHHRNVEFAEMAADHILALDNNNSTGCYILLSNLYAEVGRWADVERVRSLMKKEGLEKTPGCSVVECNGRLYKFSDHYRSLNKNNSMISEVLDILSRKIGEQMYVYSASKFKPPDLLNKRANSPTCHSVRFAVCFGLISTSVGEPVLIRKNVRICKDCHSATKRISEITNREIVVGDTKMYHHFKDGCCSCGDYW